MQEPQPVARTLPSHDDMSTLEAARLMGMAVRSVQLMVDRGELTAWKTPGGHRRIMRRSVIAWLENQTRPQPTTSSRSLGPAGSGGGPMFASVQPPKILLIEDSTHYQNLVNLLVKQHFPSVQLQVADDGIAGLAMTGQFQPDVLIVDILLPGIDGAALITSLRSHPQFADLRLVVITSLQGEQLEPYRFALEGLPLIEKPNLVATLPATLRKLLDSKLVTDVHKELG